MKIKKYLALLSLTFLLGSFLQTPSISSSARTYKKPTIEKGVLNDIINFKATLRSSMNLEKTHLIGFISSNTLEKYSNTLFLLKERVEENPTNLRRNTIKDSQILLERLYSLYNLEGESHLEKQIENKLTEIEQKIQEGRYSGMRKALENLKIWIVQLKDEKVKNHLLQRVEQLEKQLH